MSENHSGRANCMNLKKRIQGEEPNCRKKKIKNPEEEKKNTNTNEAKLKKSGEKQLVQNKPNKRILFFSPFTP